MDYFGTALAIAIFTFAASLFVHGPANSAEPAARIEISAPRF